LIFIQPAVQPLLLLLNQLRNYLPLAASMTSNLTITKPFFTRLSRDGLKTMRG
jgi:hypothetical protein